MPERDGYVAGVPCWVDTSQPDPESAVDFYSGLFGWEFEDVMPSGSEAKYFIAGLRGGDVAAVGSIPEAAPPVAMWNTYVWVESADETASRVRGADGGIVMEPHETTMAALLRNLTFVRWPADVTRLARGCSRDHHRREATGRSH